MLDGSVVTDSYASGFLPMASDVYSVRILHDTQEHRIRIPVGLPVFGMPLPSVGSSYSAQSSRACGIVLQNGTTKENIGIR